LLQSDPLLAGLVEKYGAQVVWDRGLELFGYPVIWLDHNSRSQVLASVSRLDDLLLKEGGR
jgi:hypothetical protein